MQIWLVWKVWNLRNYKEKFKIFMEDILTNCTEHWTKATNQIIWSTMLKHNLLRKYFYCLDICINLSRNLINRNRHQPHTSPDTLLVHRRWLLASDWLSLAALLVDILTIWKVFSLLSVSSVYTCVVNTIQTFCSSLPHSRVELAGQPDRRGGRRRDDEGGGHEAGHQPAADWHRAAPRPAPPRHALYPAPALGSGDQHAVQPQHRQPGHGDHQRL